VNLILVRVLHIGSKLIESGGIEKYLMNLYKHIDRNQIQFDFVILNEGDNQYYEDEVEEFGGEVYSIPIDKQPFLKCCAEKIRIFKKYKKYGVVHIHTTCGTRAVDGVLAKLCGIKHVVYHSHSNIGKPPLKYIVLRPIFWLTGKKYFACSTEAGRFFFGERIINSKKFSVAKNGIDESQFIFSVIDRENVRKEFGICDCHVIGFVGRLSPEKNIEMILSIANNIANNDKKLRLLIVGDGVEKDKINSKIQELGISDIVIMAGARSDINRIMSAMDVLLLPSLFEALGLVLIEAQASGLRCLTSDVTSRESCVSPLISYVAISKGVEAWADIIEKEKFDYSREDMSKSVIENGYSIKNTAKEMQDYYLSLT